MKIQSPLQLGRCAWLVAPIAIVVAASLTAGASSSTVIAKGAIVFVRSANGQRGLYVVNPDGSGLHQLGLGANVTYPQNPVWSPDGTQIAFDDGVQVQGGRQPVIAIDVVEQDGSQLRRVITANGGGQPSWSPSADRIAYSSADNAHSDRASIHVVNVDGSGDVSITRSTARIDFAPAWSRTGKVIAFASGGAQVGPLPRIFVVRDDGSGLHGLPTPSGWGDTSPSWSPNGRSLAFNGIHGKVDEFIVVADARGGHRRNLTRAFGIRGFNPRWSPDGKSLVYSCLRGGFEHLCIVNLSTGKARQITTGLANDTQADWHA